VDGRVVRVVLDSNVWILYLKGEEDASKLVEVFLGRGLVSIGLLSF